MDAERLRTRLMVAAQRFAAEVADAVVEATGAPAAEESRPRRRRASRAVPSIPDNVDERAALKASSSLAKLGIR